MLPVHKQLSASSGLHTKTYNTKIPDKNDHDSQDIKDRSAAFGSNGQTSDHDICGIDSSRQSPDTSADQQTDCAEFLNAQYCCTTWLERWSKTSDLGTIVTELESCRQNLKQTFRNSDGQSFAYVCCAISCVLNSRNPLHISAINVAVTLVINHRRTVQDPHEYESIAGRRWFEACSLVLHKDTKGRVHFRTAAMPLFLWAFCIRGLDASHRTIALACLIQTQLDRLSSMRSRDAAPAVSFPLASSRFSAYAASNSDYHCEKAGTLREWFLSQEPRPEAVSAEDRVKSTCLAKVQDENHRQSSQPVSTSHVSGFDEDWTVIDPSDTLSL